MAGRQCVALPNPLLFAARGALWGAARGGIAQNALRVGLVQGASRVHVARRHSKKAGVLAEGCIILTNAAHKLAECRQFGTLDKFVRAFVKVVNDWPAILPGCAAGHRGRPTPEQKSRQRIEFTSMGRIDPDADSRKPQVKALSSRRLLRVHPKIRSFGGTFAWHRAPTPLRAAFFGSRWRFSRPGGGSRCIRAAGGGAGRRPSVPWGKY